MKKKKKKLRSQGFTKFCIIENLISKKNKNLAAQRREFW